MIRVAFVVGMVLAGCKPAPLSLTPEARAIAPRDYDKIYKKWTREEKQFSFGRLANVLLVTSTFESWEFRWAYVVRYAADYQIGTQKREQMLTESMADAQRYHRFFVTMAGENYKETDLTRPDTPWRVMLINDQNREILPIEVVKLKRLGMLERMYYPSNSPFRLAFRIAFAATDDEGRALVLPRSKQLILRFLSAAGKVDLRWNFVN